MFQEDGALSLEEKVYHSLEQQILSGKFKAGEALTEVKLAKSLGVSRTPVREALQRLGREGLIRLVPNKGAVVVGISEKDLIDIYKIRMRLEGLAARIAAEKAFRKRRPHLLLYAKRKYRKAQRPRLRFSRYNIPLLREPYARQDSLGASQIHRQLPQALPLRGRKA